MVAWLGCGGSDSGSSLLAPDTEAGAGDGSTDGQSTDGSINDGSLSTADAATDAGGVGPGGDTTMIPCGGAACSIPAQVCCVTTGGGGNSASYACTTGACGKISLDGGDAAAAGGNGDVAALGCTATANCAAGSICCIHQPANGGVVAECKVGISCGNNAAQLCDPGAAVSGCPSTGTNAVCTSNEIGSWGLTPPFATCGGIGN